MAEAEALGVWPPRADSSERTLMLERLNVGGEGVAEEEMFRQHHGLNGQESEQTPGNGEDRRTCHAAVHGVTRSHLI